jgi:hypothetical protein
MPADERREIEAAMDRLLNGTPGRDLRDLDAGVGQDRVKRCGELPGAVPDQEPEPGGAIT